jgi:serine/threonine protein phosphatase 1
MKGLWHWLKKPAPTTEPAPLPAPDPPVCVVGDLHGRLDLLEQMLDAIAARDGAGTARLVFVGDMIDRGPDSAGVLRRLHALQLENPARVTCLMGNHERMALDFLAAPARRGPRWIAAGGAETLTSFGLSPYARQGPDNALEALAGAWRAALTPALTDWLTALPLSWQEGTLAVTHAGADPALPLDAQPPERLLWGARRREAALRRDAIWVAHGHTIVDQAHAAGQNIAVDTGAWRSGRLSAVWMDAEGLSFMGVTQGMP